MSQIKEVAITIDPISIDTRDTVNLPYNAYNGNSVTKMAISPQSKCIVTYSQDDGTYISWSNDSNDDGKISLKYDSSPSLFHSISFKVSDEKIIILDGESIYDMNQKPCSIIKLDYKMKGNRDAKYDFLSNGDIVAYHKRFTLLMVESIIIDLLQLSKIHYLKVLSGIYTFQYRKILLDENEKEKIMLKFSKNITVININGTLYIYSNNNNIYVPIGVIDHSTLVQDFDSHEKVDYKLIINPDGVNGNENENTLKLKGINDENIFYNIKKFSDEDQFIEHYIDLIKKQNEVKKEQNKNELIKEASTVSSKVINAKAREDLLISSIIFGFIHLSFEIRQFIWNPKQWFNVWNFFVLLEPKFEFSENDQGDLKDPNNPWVLTTKYHQISENGTINSNAVLVQEPDEYTNLFSNYANSLLAILKDIELFYLLPHQRLRTDWFPDIIYYYANVDEIRKKYEETA
ncbi:hypothetical protein RhiirC2_869096 [Rhizophagus irregularis]|uniref:Uncharacterized protein n=1 Tax=Rhizophagus irregularis TaxID=588596 RepID=A0A2N1MT99_9GLOM|nr:hypothetical protein RhiirC2_869096 [Rhizophagus irregularis]